MNFNALILHGKPSREKYENPDLPKPHDANWLPWLQSELGKRGLSSAIPQFPKPYFPEYDAYVAEFEQYEIDENSVIVAHSAGCDFILRYLSENPEVAVRQLVLVAPWTDSSKKYGNFSEYILDKDIAYRVGRIVVINSLDDSLAIQENVRKLISDLNSIDYIELDGFGHFMIGNNMTGQAFPELLREIETVIK